MHKHNTAHTQTRMHGHNISTCKQTQPAKETNKQQMLNGHRAMSTWAFAEKIVWIIDCEHALARQPLCVHCVVEYAMKSLSVWCIGEWMQLVCVDAKHNSSPSTQPVRKYIMFFFRAASPSFSSLILCLMMFFCYYLLILIIVGYEIDSRFHLPSPRYWVLQPLFHCSFSHKTWIRLNAILDSAIVRNKYSDNCFDIHFAVIN